MPISSVTCPFTFDQFASLNKPNFEKELSFESDPFRVIHVKNGVHEMQFSFIQPCEKISSDFQLLQNDTWTKWDNMFVCFKCIAKDVPNHCYSIYPESKSCRYKMTVSFPMAGNWCVKVFANSNYLFEVYYEVEKAHNSIKKIPGYDQQKNGFIPIYPLEGLTKLVNGFAQIRFAIKMKRSPITIKFFEIKKGSFERIGQHNDQVKFRFITMNLPFKCSNRNENDDPRKMLVEDWIWVDFPKIGPWEVFTYFKDDNIENKNYTYGVKYYFDVNKIGDQIENAIYNVPKTRTFAPFFKFKNISFNVRPSDSTIVLYDTYDFYFHIYCEKKPNAFLKYFDGDEEK